MKSLKRICAIVLCLGICVSCFAGCGTKDEVVDSNLKTIKVWSANGSSKEFYLDKIDKFNKTLGMQNGIRVEYEVVADMNKMVDLGIQTGELPHVFSGSKLKTLVEKDLILPLSELPGGQAIIDNNPVSDNNENCVFEGKVYCVPFNMGVRAILYNKDMLKANGFVDENGEAKPPKSLKELREYAKKMTNPSKNEYGIIIPFKWGSALEDFLGCSQSINGFGTFNPKTGLYDFSAYKPIMETLMGIKEDASFVPGVEGIDNDSARARFGAGGIALKFGYSWDFGVLTEQFPAKIDWGIAPLPVTNEDGTKYKQVCSYGYTSKVNKSVIEEIGAEKFMVFWNWYISDDFRRELYEAGHMIPTNQNIIDSAKLSEDKTHWGEFASLVEISAIPPVAVKTETTGMENLQVDFLKSVWSGDESIESFVKRRQEAQNNAIKLYKEHNPNYDGSVCINKDWDISY